MKIIVSGAGGFIGWHLVKRLKAEGHTVIGLDRKYPEFFPSIADEHNIVDLRHYADMHHYFAGADEVYQLAAEMGGANYIFTGEHDAEIMQHSAQININVLEACRKHNVGRIFFSSSACVYPEYEQIDPDNCALAEPMAYPAAPDSEYGWEKLFSERLYQAYARNYDMTVRIARYHNIFGTHSTWCGGREKAPAAICRKVAEASDGGTIEIWGDGEQTRSFLYIDDCIDGTLKLMRSHCEDVLNIGSEEMVTINSLVAIAAFAADKKIKIKHVDGPLGVRGRNSDNTFVRKELGWEPRIPLGKGIGVTYPWIEGQVRMVAALDRRPRAV